MEKMQDFIIQNQNKQIYYDQTKLDLILRCINDKKLLKVVSTQLSVGVDPLYKYIEYFNKLKELYNLNCNIIELGFGTFPIMSFLIDHEQSKTNQGSVTAYDGRAISYDLYDKGNLWDTPVAPLGNIKYKFHDLNRNSILPEYDLIFGIKTCSGLTEIVRKANRDKKEFFLVPCDCYPPEFVNYLYNIAKEGTDNNSEIIIDDSLNKSYPILARRKK